MEDRIYWFLGPVVVLATLGCSSEPLAGSVQPSPLPVSVLEVVMSDHYELSRAFTGVVRSGRSSQLGFERGGRVVRVTVKDGQHVRRGQSLARLDTAQLRAERHRLSAKLTESAAARSIAELTASRLKRLADEKFVPRQESDEARYGLEAARARVDQLHAAIAGVDVKLAQSTLVAPFSGTVAVRLVDEGTVVAAGVPVLRLLDEETRKQAVVGVPVVLAGVFVAGSTHTLRIAGRELTGTVSGQVNDVDLQTRTTAVIFSLPEGSQVVPGEVTRLLHTRRVTAPGAWVPNDALTQGTHSLWSAFALAPDGENFRIRRREVEVLHSESERSYVVGTLENADRIVASGLHRVVPGQRVSTSNVSVARSQP